MDCERTIQDGCSGVHPRSTSGQGDIGEAPISVADTLEPKVQLLSEGNTRGVWHHKESALTPCTTHLWDTSPKCRM